MPIYDYYCTECGFEKEFLQKASEAPRTHCPQCNQETLVKGLSAPRFRLSGSGWYETDEKPKDKQRNITTKDSQPTKSGDSVSDSQ